MRFLFFILWAATAQAQQLQVVNVTGNMLSSPAMTVEYSVGEVSVVTLLAGEDAATQGFIQPSEIDCGDIASALSLVLTDDQTEVSPQNPVVALHPLGNDQLSGGFSPWLMAFTQGSNGAVSQTDSVSLTYTLQNPAFSGLDSFYYTVCIAECKSLCDTALVYVMVRSNITERILQLIPNAITPNGDSKNDIFDPLSILIENGVFYLETQAEFVVLNRWGEVVFHAHPYQPWAGEGSNHKTLPQGTYYYHLRLHGLMDTEELKGPVHLLR